MSIALASTLSRRTMRMDFLGLLVVVHASHHPISTSRPRHIVPLLKVETIYVGIVWKADGEARSVGTASPVRRYGSAPPADDSKSDKSSSVTEVTRQQLGRLDTTCQNSPADMRCLGCI